MAKAGFNLTNAPCDLDLQWDCARRGFESQERRHTWYFSRIFSRALVEVAHVLLELPSPDSLQEPRKRRLVRALPSRHRGFILQYLILVHRRGHDDALAGVAPAKTRWMPLLDCPAVLRMNQAAQRRHNGCRAWAAFIARTLIAVEWCHCWGVRAWFPLIPHTCPDCNRNCLFVLFLRCLPI